MLAQGNLQLDGSERGKGKGTGPGRSGDCAISPALGRTRSPVAKGILPWSRVVHLVNVVMKHWNVIVIFEMFMTLGLMGKQLVRRDSASLVKPFGADIAYKQINPYAEAPAHQVGIKMLLGIVCCNWDEIKVVNRSRTST